MDRKKAAKIYSTLKRAYPSADTALTHADAWELLVATILSAQCTDARVNKVTPDLFERYPDVRAFARARRADVEMLIRSTGFFRSKASNVVGAARMIVEDFGGAVPGRMDDLIRLPGVARKTANIVLFHSFGLNEGVAVDTHVKRLSRLLGLTVHADPVKIEKDLMSLFEKKEWGRLTDVFIQHGRAVCVARRPQCDRCPVRHLCPSANQAPGRLGRGEE